MKRRHIIHIFVLSLLTIVRSVATGQSLNLDAEGGGGFPTLGYGLPSKHFAGVGAAGYWNPFSGSAARRKLALRRLDGEWMAATLLAPFHGTGGSSLSLNTGDYRSLLNDAAGIGIDAPNDLQFEGLESGTYKVIVYSVNRGSRPGDSPIPSHITVHGAITPNPQVSTGPMPGNQLVEGITHTVHFVEVANGSLHITIASGNGTQGVQFNGLQLVKLPQFRLSSLFELGERNIFQLLPCGCHSEPRPNLSRSPFALSPQPTSS